MTTGTGDRQHDYLEQIRHFLLIKDELRYCRETNRIYGLWNDHCWHKAETQKEKQA